MDSELIAQIISIGGMSMNVLSFQRKEQKQIIFMQLLGSTLFGISYFMIGAFVGGMLNVVGMIRAIVYYKRELFRTDKIYWVWGLSAAYVAIYVTTFALLGTEPSAGNLAVEALPTVGMIITTFSFYLGKASAVRFIGILNSPLWLVYNIVEFNIGGIITEVIVIASIIIAILRYDLKRDKEKNKNQR